MPVMDGFELISHIVRSMQTEHIPIIAITSHEDLTAKVHLMKGVYGISINLGMIENYCQE